LLGGEVHPSPRLQTKCIPPARFPLRAAAGASAASTVAPLPARFGSIDSPVAAGSGTGEYRAHTPPRGPGHKTGPECTDRFRNEMTRVIAEPYLRGQRRGDDHQRVIHRVGPCRGHDLLRRLRSRPTLGLRRGGKRKRSGRCTPSPACLGSARSLISPILMQLSLAGLNLPCLLD
jgi:hypothetical protein